MNILKNIAVSFGTFSRIPMPLFEWNEENMRYMLAVFPLVGVFTGFCMVVWYQLCMWLGFGSLLLPIGLLVIPILITGGIHLDGYCDVCDALASHAEPERKRAILKDPHIGAFAAIWLAVYVLVYVGALYELPYAKGIDTVLLLACAQVLSRALAGLASLLFPLSAQRGMLAAQAEPAGRTGSIVTLSVFAAVAVVAMIIINPVCGLVMVAGAVAVFFIVKHIAAKHFEGMSGDLAGYLVQVSELVMVLVFAISAAVLFMLVDSWVVY